jgi:hypothetical protein
MLFQLRRERLIDIFCDEAKPDFQSKAFREHGERTSVAAVL